jgi:deoxyribonuclease-2
MWFHPDIFASNVNPMYHNLTALVKGQRFVGAHIYPLPTSFSATSFAKSNSWGKDLYEDLVSPYYRQGFYWETWRRSPAEPTFCTPTYAYDAINVNTVAFPGVSFSYTKDHSKWGVSIQPNNLACVGGINRMTSQSKRGGGTVCMNNAALWRSLTAIIAQHDSC